MIATSIDGPLESTVLTLPRWMRAELDERARAAMTSRSAVTRQLLASVLNAPGSPSGGRTAQPLPTPSSGAA